MPEEKSTRREVLKLTVANAVESGLRLVVPVVLVRLLDQSEFGEYRLFWLVANTLTLLIPMAIGRSLLYFLPRSGSAERGAIVSQSLFYFSIVSLPIAILVGSGSSILPENVATLTDPRWVLGAFTFLWLVSSMINVLPNADQDIAWQMWAIIGLAIVRFVIIIAVAWSTRDLQALFIGLAVFALLQTAVLGYYVATRYGKLLGWPRWAGLKRQLEYSVPFGVSGILSRGRRQIEQWIVALMFVAESLAIFSIAVSFNGILSLLRSAVGNVLLPKMSRRHAGGDVLRALELNNRGNLSICFLIYPVIVFIWVFAAPIVEFLYTSDYLDAVPVIRVYALNMFLMSVELATVLMIYEQGRFVAAVSAGVLIGASLASYAGAVYLGLSGVVIGGLLGTLVTRILNFNRAAKMLGVKFSELQDWKSLRRMLLAALIAGTVAYATRTTVFPSASPFVTILAGGTVLATAYVGMIVVLRVHWVPLSMLGRSGWPSERSG